MTVTAPAVCPPPPSTTSRSRTRTRTSGILEKAWIVDFLDVPPGQQFYNFVTTLVSNAITVGVGSGLYGVERSDPSAADGRVPPQGPPRHLLRAASVHGSLLRTCPAPRPSPTGSRRSPPRESPADAAAATTAPQNPVRRDQMAVFLLKAKHGPGYTPPAVHRRLPRRSLPVAIRATGSSSSPTRASRGAAATATTARSTNNTRGQMAVFLVKTFDLQ